MRNIPNFHLFNISMDNLTNGINELVTSKITLHFTAIYRLSLGETTAVHCPFPSNKLTSLQLGSHPTLGEENKLK